MMMMIMMMRLQSASLHQKFDIWETLSINFNCVGAPGIDVVNTESTFASIVTLRSVGCPFPVTGH